MFGREHNSKFSNYFENDITKWQAHFDKINKLLWPKANSKIQSYASAMREQYIEL